MSDDARTIIKRKEALEERRAPALNWWQAIALRVMPSSATFTVDGPEGQKHTERQFSGRPVIANERFSAIMDDLMTPRNMMWHGLGPEDEELADQQDIKIYFERLTKLLFAERYAPTANFASEKSRGYLSLGAFGNSCLFIDEIVGRGPRYRQIFMKEVLWSENHQGAVDTLYRPFRYQARQIVQRFGNKNLPPKVQEAITNKKDFQEFDFIHCVSPNEERIESRKDYRGMPWSSYYLMVDDKHIMEESGYTSFPYAIGRYMLAPGETYARSPAMACWGAILTINEEKKTIMRGGQIQVAPPLLLNDDGALDAFNMRSHSLNYGTLSADGTPLVQPLKMGGDIPLGMELMEIEGKEIDDSFLVSVWNMLLAENIDTAAQVYQIIQQKAATIAPVAGRQETEDLGPLIHRELDILAKQSKYAWINTDMPAALKDSGGPYKVRFTSPLAKAMRAQDAVAITRVFEALGQAVQLDPSAAFVIDIPESLREMTDITGMPQHLVRDKDTVLKMQADHSQAQQVNQAVAAAPNVSAAVLNAAKAEQLRTGA